MASRNLHDLHPSVQRKAERFQKLAARQDLAVLIYCTLRTPQEQAKLYRQGRSIGAIRRKAAKLREINPALAELLIAVGPQSGPKVTNAGPGQSMHQYGYAFDGCPLRHGKPVWAVDDPLWLRYGECAVAAGLEWAGHWRRFREYPHCQAPGKDWRDLIGRLTL